jgi:hypothetical protein
VRTVGLRVIVEDADATVSVTGTETAVAPVALTVMVPLCVPAVSAPVVTVAETVPLLVPEAGLTVNQLVLALADQVSVPPPVLLIVNNLGAGLLPPWVAVKERLVGLAPMAGGTGAVVTVNVTGTVTLEAPVAASIIVPL